MLPPNSEFSYSFYFGFAIGFIISMTTISFIGVRYIIIWEEMKNYHNNRIEAEKNI